MLPCEKKNYRLAVFLFFFLLGLVYCLLNILSLGLGDNEIGDLVVT